MHLLEGLAFLKGTHERSAENKQTYKINNN